jgi:hypothetical protein
MLVSAAVSIRYGLSWTMGLELVESLCMVFRGVPNSSSYCYVTGYICPRIVLHWAVRHSRHLATWWPGGLAGSPACEHGGLFVVCLSS